MQEAKKGKFDVFQNKFKLFLLLKKVKQETFKTFTPTSFPLHPPAPPPAVSLVLILGL